MSFVFILLSITPAKAALASAVIPGSGDLLLGEQKRGLYFMVAETAIWVSYLGCRSEEGHLDRSSKNFALLHASANIKSKGTDYFSAMEDFRTSEEYNETVKEAARRKYPDTLDAEVMKERIQKRKEYIEKNSFKGSDAWSWHSEDSKEKYRDLRKSKRGFHQKATNLVGLAVANRVISFFVSYFAGNRLSVEVKEKEVKVGFKF